MLDDEMNEEACGMTQREMKPECQSYWLAKATYVLDGRRDEHGTGREEWSGDYAAAWSSLNGSFGSKTKLKQLGTGQRMPNMEALFWRMAFTFEMSAWRNKLDRIAESLLKKRKLSAAECHSIYTARERSGIVLTPQTWIVSSPARDQVIQIFSQCPF